MNPTTAVLVISLGIHVLAVGGLWLRLRWRAEQQRVHRGYLIALVRALPEGSRVDDVHGDGRRTRLILGSEAGRVNDRRP